MWCAASCGAIGAFIRLLVHEISLYSWRSHGSDTIHHIFTFEGVNVKILWWHAYNIRTRSKQAWCAASFGAIGSVIRLLVHEISLYSWRSHGSDTIHHIFTFQGVNLKILWWHAYDVRTWSKHAWCAASFGAIGSVIRLGVHEISLYSWRSHGSDTIHHIFTFQGVNLKILWWHAYDIRTQSKQAWCAAS